MWFVLDFLWVASLTVHYLPEGWEGRAHCDDMWWLLWSHPWGWGWGGGGLHEVESCALWGCLFKPWRLRVAPELWQRPCGATYAEPSCVEILIKGLDLWLVTSAADSTLLGIHQGLWRGGNLDVGKVDWAFNGIIWLKFATVWVAGWPLWQNWWCCLLSGLN